MIGFTGTPFTLLCYWTEGGSTKIFSKFKKFLFGQKELALEVLQKLTDIIKIYLEK